MVEDIVRRKGYLTLGSRMRRIGERLQAEVQQLMDERNVPIQSSQYPLLGALDENGPLAIGDLAEALGVSQPGVTRNAGLLAKQGIVTISRGRKDQRTRIVALTDAGRAVVRDGHERVWPQVQSCLAEILAGQAGSLLDQLDILEDELRAMSFPQRVAKTKREDAHG